MKWESGGDMPDGRWIQAKQAAEIWSRASQPVSEHRMREWVKQENPHLAGIRTWHIGDRYYINLDDVLDTFEARAKAALAVVAEERAKLSED